MSHVNPTIVKENEHIARSAYEKGEFVLCYLLVHSLIESLLRTFQINLVTKASHN